MPTTLIGNYDIDYSGVALPDDAGWAAHVAIHGPSANPMHRNTVFPPQRVLVDQVFASREEAEAQALQAATAMLPPADKQRAEE
ncbi:hypothetical protein GCM10007205_27230 [Oxalicibacterium flavum]|uniref:Uncharacterized protein n=1 Tax=Oxalicibacterium flavum TaxID=179467 RepID=A0A8J2UNB5_9BURK|nr:hypothetical protein [Oxalicibacterium flavum]GGC16809.1 hypothetical protein GCM10007205_27230 [Oxalicibacterium flavum]